MNCAKITPRFLDGKVNAIPSKSMLHRSIICAALCKNEQSIIKNVVYSEDVKAAIDCAKKIVGADIRCFDDYIVIIGGNIKQNPMGYVGESASTLRFFIPISMLKNGAEFKCKDSLMKRPLDKYISCIGANCKSDKDIISINGSLQGGEYKIDGNISSQYISGLLFALPLVDCDSRITLISKLESKPYVDMTIDMLKRFGIDIIEDSLGYLIKGGQHYKNNDIVIEGDWSYGSYFYLANFMGSNIEISGLDSNSLQGDRRITEFLLKDDIDISNTPDLFPTLVVAACAKKGRTRLFNAKRLRYKESDRLHSMAIELAKIGADVEEYDSELIINGKGFLNGGTVDSHNDHRIVMSLAMASCICKNPVIIKNVDAVKKSAPSFFEVFKNIGGNICEYMGE